MISKMISKILSIELLLAAKVWFFTKPSDRIKYEKLILRNCDKQKHLNYLNVEQIYKHKLFIVSPETLSNEEIGVFKLIQKVGEYIVTFADSYHMGFNSGFNIGEAVNFMFYNDILMKLE